ncbi:relaxase MobL, partial [Staphylococcus epidermidis]|uniref:relaxase MobL n=1 Tax=Staphylococcus epidermidis TaxID=1282 RepID=UPI001C9319FF
KHNLFDKYLHYISIHKLKNKQPYNKHNLKKTTTITFNSQHQFIQQKHINTLKHNFQQPNKNNHLIYQHLLSFHNQFLKHNHLFNQSLHKLHQPKIKKPTPPIINQIIKHNKIDKNHTFSSANIHYHTH